ncbi:hypothetical protein DFP73DRAFT_595568 [Morchella snyderi]|nr:hypothetical protein DFP73DRAFT_595568 [Morchella snyderi]
MHQQTLLFLRAQPIRPGRQEHQAPPGQNARAWGRLSLAITPDADRADCLCLATPEAPPLCLALPKQSFQAPSAARAQCTARAVCSRPELPEQTAHVRRFQSSMLASGAARAECSFSPLPEPYARVRRCQCSVLALGAARAEYSFPPLHATSPSQSTRSTQYRRIHPPSGDNSLILYSPAAARASY